jgi:NAD(P)H-flavin reductase
MHALREGDQIGLRGPYGRPFVMEALQGHDLLFVAGGIGLAPLRSVINGCLDTAGHGKITILYGSRVPSDIAFRADIDTWHNHPAVDCRLTVDVAEPGWDGPVGLVTGLLEQLTVNPATSTALVCGPPVMIGAVLNALGAMGFADEDILTTMERHMKCGIGVCRHCHMGSKLICVDGPVFSLAQLKELSVMELAG